MDGFEMWKYHSEWYVLIRIHGVDHQFTEDDLRRYSGIFNAAEIELNRRIAAEYPTEDDGEAS